MVDRCTDRVKLTPWFPAGVRPVRVGVYEVRDPAPVNHFPDMRWYAYWDGERFGFRTCSKPDTAALASIKKMFTCLPALTEWRGRARRPR